MKIFLKKNKILFLMMLLLILIIGFSIYTYHKEYYGYGKWYDEVKLKCTKDNWKNDEICKEFSSYDQVKKYIDNENPKEKFKKLDAITLTCEVVEHYAYSILQIFSPLLVIVTLVFLVHKEYESGMFKNYLTRMSYKKYLKTIFKACLKSAMIIPLSLVILFIISCFITSFNFDFQPSIVGYSVYNRWKYENFLLYGMLICVMQFFLSFAYACLGLIACKKNKNGVVATVMGYLLFLILDLVIYIGIYVYLINKLLGIKELTDYFSLSGYWFFNGDYNYFLLVLIPFLTMVIVFIITYLVYRRKEVMIIESEKQTA